MSQTVRCAGLSDAAWTERRLMILPTLFIVNAIATFAAGVVLFAAPDLIPGAVGVRLDRSAYLISYLLGSSEFAFAALCLAGSRLRDRSALRAIAWTCIVFHAASGAAEAYAFFHGVSAAIWWNVALRVVMVVLFGYFGLVRTPEASSAG